MAHYEAVPGEHVKAVAKYFLDETSAIMKTSDRVGTIVGILANSEFDLNNPDTYEFFLDLTQGLMCLETLRASSGLYD